MFGRYGRLVAAFGGLALASSLGWQVVGQPSAKQEHAEAAAKQTPPPPRQDAPKTSEDSTGGTQQGERDRLDLERRATEATEKQAIEAARANSWGPRNFGLSALQAVATVASVIFTGWAAVAAARAARSAKQAVDVIPILERAYPFIVIEEETIQRSLNSYAQDNTIVITSVGPTPKLKFSVKNYGRTPARILDIVGHFRIARTPPTVDSGDKTFIPYESMLATGDKTDPPFEISLDNPLAAADFLAVHNGTAKIWFTGWISYRDMWGKDDSVMFAWRWNVGLKKLVLSKDKAPD